MVSNNLVRLSDNLKIHGYEFINKHKKIQCLNRDHFWTFTIEAVLGKFQFQNAPVCSFYFIKNIVDFTVGITLRTHNTTQISSLQHLLIFLSQWLSQVRLQNVLDLRSMYGGPKFWDREKSDWLYVKKVILTSMNLFESQTVCAVVKQIHIYIVLR